MLKRATRRHSRALFAGVLAALAACEGDILETPIEIRGQVFSPNGPEGAGVIQLVGPGMGAVRPIAGRVFSEARGDTVRVVVVLEVPGTIEFLLESYRRKTVPTGQVLQVSDGDDRLRQSVGEYRVEFTR